MKISERIFFNKREKEKEKEINDKYNKKDIFKADSLNNSVGIKLNNNKKNNKNISDININEFIEIDNDSIKNDFPYIIKYKNQLYIIGGANPF